MEYHAHYCYQRGSSRKLIQSLVSPQSDRRKVSTLSSYERMNDMYKFDSIRDGQIKRGQERCPIRLDFVIGYCLHEAKKIKSPLPHALSLPSLRSLNYLAKVT